MEAISPQPKKVLFVTPTLGGGGAERVMSYIATELQNSNNYDVTILLLREKGNNYLSALPKSINIDNIGLTGKLQNNVFKIVKAILKHRPDICFIGLDALNFLLAPFIPIFRLYKIKLVIRETNVLSYRWAKWKITPLLKICYRIFYNNYSVVVCQSDDMLFDLRDVWHIDKKKLIKINNPVDCNKVIKESKEKKLIDAQSPYFVAIGRLHPQKGFDKLIENIAILNSKGRFPYKLYVLGEGLIRDALESLIKRLGLQEKVFLSGHISNPYPIIKDAKGLILSSVYEGFPNVLPEANALGIPVFANKCPGGINEIIIEEVNGLTADFQNIEDFERKFDRFLNIKFSAEEIQNLNYSRYSTTVIMPKFMKLF